MGFQGKAVYCLKRDDLARLSIDLDNANTVADWNRVERKWAILISYACALRMHEEHWAGEDRKDFIVDRDEFDYRE